MFNTCTCICFKAILIPIDIYCLFTAKPQTRYFVKVIWNVSYIVL